MLNQNLKIISQLNLLLTHFIALNLFNLKNKSIKERIDQFKLAKNLKRFSNIYFRASYCSVLDY